MRGGQRSCGLFPRGHAIVGADIGIEPLANRLQAGLREIAFEQTPHSRLEMRVVGLVVTLPEASENTEDARVALRRQRPLSALEIMPVAGRRNVAVEHRSLDFLRNIASGVLEY